MKKPSREDGERCIALRIISKRGERLGAYDRRFVDRMGHEYPEWYSVTEPRVFNESAPFGSDVEREVSDDAYTYDDSGRDGDGN